MSKGKVMLAYSGGLDTSCICVWLQDEGYEVLCYLANVGQEEDFAAAERKARKIGASNVIVEDLRQEFVTEFVFPAIQANVIYEGVYLLGTALARPCIARGLLRAANRESCEFIAHGCTGKGNDQVRFELSAYALKPDIKVIAPWRTASFLKRFQGRKDLLKYAEEKGIPVAQTVEKPWSTDENLYHISYEAGILEDPGTQAPADMYKLTADPTTVSHPPDYISITFKDGLPVRVRNEGDGTDITEPLALFLYLNKVGRKHGIGRIDIVENRFIGIKSRGVYETPGGTILRLAHMDIEGIAMDREVRRLRDVLSVKLSELFYNGFWYSPERDFIMAAVRQSQEVVDGTVRLMCVRGSAYVLARESSSSLYDKDLSSMDIEGGFNPIDSEGFIKIHAIRLKAHAAILQKKGIMPFHEPSLP